MKKEDVEKTFGSIKMFEDERGYKSPIDIIYSDIQMKMEDNVCKAVQSVGVNVDKDELIKALQYDREQYTKGFTDGYAQGIEVGKKIVLAELAKKVLREGEAE